MEYRRVSGGRQPACSVHRGFLFTIFSTGTSSYKQIMELSSQRKVSLNWENEVLTHHEILSVQKHGFAEDNLSFWNAQVL